MFELSFQVTRLRASLYKSQGLAGEKPLGHVAFGNFSLLLLLTQHDMKIEVCLGSVPLRPFDDSPLTRACSSLFMEVAEPGFEPVQLFSSADESAGKNLLRADYTRVQSTSPEYLSHYEGYDQIIFVDVSTVIFRVAPEPLVTFYDLLMTTFVQSSPSLSETPVAAQDSSAISQPKPESPSRTSKLRLLVKLASVERGVFV
jgi:vacuolar protein sorting-associated protein 13A/C